MKKIYSLLFVAASCFMAQTMQAQCGLSLSTTASTVCEGNTVTLTATATPPVTPNTLLSTLAGGNNHRGNMFDIFATNTVTITAFDAHPMGNTTIEIYYRTSPYAGFETSSTGWTLIGSAAVTAQPFGTATPVPVPVNVTIPAGQTYSFYVTSTNIGVSLNYTDGTSEGATYTSDANITFRQGVGMEYPFTNGSGSVFRPRVWNGVIHYTVPVTATTTYLWNTSATTQSITPTVNASTQYTVQVDVTGCPTMYDTIDIQVSNPPVNAGPDVTVCSGSPVTLTGSGAVSYSWNNSVTDGVAFTPASTMNYVVTGTDTIGCTATDTLTVTVNSLPAVNAGTDVAVCEGAPVTLSGSGAVSYSWDNGVTDGVAFTPASTMDYIVTGTDANSCMNTDTVTVTVNSLPTVNAGTDAAVCVGAAVTLSGSGAVSYSWDNGVTNGVAFTPASTMDYIVTGTDANSCMNTDTVTVTVNSLPAVNAGADVAICEGSQVTLSGSGAVSYSWDNGVTDGVAFTPVTTMDYIVMGTDGNGCMNTDTVTVIVNTVNVATTVLNETITAAASGASYAWIDCSDNSVIAGATSQSYTATLNGSYAVIVTENGCIDTSVCQAITSVGIEGISTAAGISIYPNPTSGQITIKTGNIVASEVSIADVTGKIIARIQPEEAQFVIDLNAYANGIYFIRINTVHGLRTEKLIKQ